MLGIVFSTVHIFLMLALFARHVSHVFGSNLLVNLTLPHDDSSSVQIVASR